MSVNFQQVRQQIHNLGETASISERQHRERLEKALGTLFHKANELDALRDKVLRAAIQNPNLRSALPLTEPLNHTAAAPEAPTTGHLLAADGSQINPDRHAAVDYCLVNVGAIQMALGAGGAPTPTIQSRLIYDQEMYTPFGRVTEQWVALIRDISERKLLVELAAELAGPIITLTDGPLELWIGRDQQLEQEYHNRFAEYLDTLERLRRLNASTAGYVDRPSSSLVVQLLEIADLPDTRLGDAGREHALLGVTDADLFKMLLGPGERSAVFGIQSRLAGQYAPEIALQFFYLNVGRPEHPYLARVEIPAWVSAHPAMLAQVHATLVSQSKALGARPYPYLLHRAHEVAVVSKDEKEQIETMIAIELRQRGLGVDDKSSKQNAKDVTGDRKRY